MNLVIVLVLSVTAAFAAYVIADWMYSKILDEEDESMSDNNDKNIEDK